MRALALAAVLPLLVAASPARAQAPTDDPALPLVYVISVDALDGDAVDDGRAPFLRSLTRGQGGRTTLWRESRAIMVAETNPNHVAMATGAYPDRSGITGNDFAVFGAAAQRACGGDGASPDRPEAVNGEQAACLQAESFFSAARRLGGPGRVTTAGIFGKPKLAQIFATRLADPRRYDADFLWSPCDPREPTDYCDRSVPARPNDGYAFDDRSVMDTVLRTVRDGVATPDGRRRPNLTFVNLPTVDSAGHGFGTGPAYDQGVRLADDEVRRLVDGLRAAGLWQRSFLFVVSDHSMEATPRRVRLDDVFRGAGIDPSSYVVTGNSGTAMVYMADRRAPGRFDLLRRLRAAAIGAPGVDEALYRAPNPADGGDAHHVARVHPAWRMTSERHGDLIVTQQPGGVFQAPVNPLTGNHGSPATLDNTMLVASGGDAVVQQVLDAPAAPRFDDTLANPLQAENVDVAPTVMALLRRSAPAQSAGRRLAEAFAVGVLPPSGGERCGSGPLLRVTAAGRELRVRAPAGGRVDLLQVAAGRRLVGLRRVARATGGASLRPRRAGAGIYVVRLRAEGVARRVAVERRRAGGAWRVLAPYERREPCGLLTEARLSRPVLRGSLRVEVRLAGAATVRAELLRSGVVVARARARAGAGARVLQLSGRGLRPGPVLVRVTAAGGGRRAVARLIARRL